MIAALGTVKESLDLIEGWWLTVFDPPMNNADAVQVSGRQFRIGQLSPKVVTEYLVHKDSVVEGNIE